MHLPSYKIFLEDISELALHISASELHGIMCGYLCADHASKGEAFLWTLLSNKMDKSARKIAGVLFNVYSISQQQIDHFDFEFQLLLPPEQQSLVERAQAFSEWCKGFVQGIRMAGVSIENLKDEECQEALQHVSEFAKLDYHALSVGEDDEKALMEVSEYTRMAVLRIHGDIHQNRLKGHDENQQH